VPKGPRSDELVEIAAGLFLERGYDATSMQEIADQMGILKGSVYHYVRTKEDLLWMIVEPRLKELVDNARAIFEQRDKAVLERITLAIEAHAHSYEVHYPFMFVIIREDGRTISPKRQKLYQALQQEYYQLWKVVIEEGVAIGELRNDLDGSTIAHGVLGMVNWMYRWFRPDGPMNSKDVAQTFASMVASGLSVEKGSVTRKSRAKSS
jgi:AcrR family transcriptional regulator